MNGTRGAVALAVATVAWAPQAPAVQRFPDAQCRPIAISSAENPGQRVRFSAARVVDLKFHLFAGRGLEGPHTLTLKVYTPSGHLYQELTVAFRADSAVRRRGLRRQWLTARLPVAGTAITTSGLFGRWRVEPHLDGSLRPCGSATSFQITR